MNILLSFIRAVCFFGLGVFTLSAAPVDYQRDIRPLLKNKCSTCHDALKQKAKLRLDAGKLIHQGGKEGKVIVPGNAKSSELIARVTARGKFRLVLFLDEAAVLGEGVNEADEIGKQRHHREEPLALYHNENSHSHRHGHGEDDCKCLEKLHTRRTLAQ